MTTLINFLVSAMVVVVMLAGCSVMTQCEADRVHKGRVWGGP